MSQRCVCDAPLAVQLEGIPLPVMLVSREYACTGNDAVAFVAVVLGLLIADLPQVSEATKQRVAATVLAQPLPGPDIVTRPELRRSGLNSAAPSTGDTDSNVQTGNKSRGNRVSR